MERKKEKNQNTESVRAGLGAMDTCKLGYSCLSTNRYVSFKWCCKHYFPLNQTCNYTGEMTMDCYSLVRKPSCCLFWASVLRPWSKQPQPCAPLIKESHLLRRCAGYQNNHANPHHSTLKCSVCLANNDDFKHRPLLWGGLRQMALSLVSRIIVVLGLLWAQEGIFGHTNQACSRGKKKIMVGKVY